MTSHSNQGQTALAAWQDRDGWRAWISALCSYREAFGLVLVESLASGTPIVAIANSGLARPLRTLATITASPLLCPVTFPCASTVATCRTADSPA